MTETVADVPAASMARSRAAGSAVNSGWVSTETTESSAVSGSETAARMRTGRLVMGASGGWWMCRRR